MNTRNHTQALWAFPIVALATLVFASTSANAEVILSSNFDGVDKTDSSAPYTATNITWDTVNGIVLPVGELTFVDPTGGDVSGFYNKTADEIDVKYNMTGDGPWSTSISLVLDAGTSSIDLTSLDFNWRVTNNSGSDNSPNQKQDTWTVEIVGDSTGSLGTASIGPAPPGNPTQFRSIDLTGFSLTDTENYTLSLRIDGTGWGHNASLQDIELHGIASGPTADFNEDGVVDLIDVNLLTAEADLPTGLLVPLADAKFDLTGDDVVNSADLDQWLADAATINGFGSPYLKGDANLDVDVDVWAFDGTGDAQVLSSNLGTMSGMVWGDADFNGDGDVDVWAFDGSGDAQQLSSNLGATNDAAAGTAEAIYNALTGELSFDVGEGIGVIGVQAEGMKHGDVDSGSPLGTPGQNAGNVLAYFSASGLAGGLSNVGAVLPPGLTADEIAFGYTPLGGATTSAAVTVIVPEPSTVAMLLVVGLIGFVRWRREA